MKFIPLFSFVLLNISLSSCNLELAAAKAEKAETTPAATDTTEEEPTAETAKEFSFEDTADFVILRLVGEDSREGRDERSLVLANKLHGVNIASQDQSSAQSNDKAAQAEPEMVTADEMGEENVSSDVSEPCMHSVTFDVETQTETVSEEAYCSGNGDEYVPPPPSDDGSCNSFVINAEGDVAESCDGYLPPEEEQPEDLVVDHCMETMIYTDSGDSLGTALRSPDYSGCYDYIPIVIEPGYCGSTDGIAVEDVPVETNGTASSDGDSAGVETTTNATDEAAPPEPALRLAEAGTAENEVAPADPMPIDPITVYECSDPIADKIAQGHGGTQILRELLLVILSLFDADASGTLSIEERNDAVTVIIKAIF